MRAGSASLHGIDSTVALQDPDDPLLEHGLGVAGQERLRALLGLRMATDPTERVDGQDLALGAELPSGELGLVAIGLKEGLLGREGQGRAGSLQDRGLAGQAIAVRRGVGGRGERW